MGGFGGGGFGEGGFGGAGGGSDQLLISTPNAKISDLSGEVLIRCENRQASDLNRSYVWLRDALLEISGNPNYRDDFDALEVMGPPFLLTAGVQEYDEANILPVASQIGTTFFNLATLVIVIWLDPPVNSNRIKLRWGSYQEADQYSSNSPTRPEMAYRFAGNIGFVPTADRAYQVQARVLQRHPLADDQLQNTDILLPREWYEILIWSAVMRGFMENLEFEKASKIRTLLQGDPKDPSHPGLIYSVKNRRNQENWRQEASLSPDVRSYGWGR